MPTSAKPKPEDLKLAAQRAKEWKGFRRNFLYSQKHLAHALRCSRRTVCAVESGHEVMAPSFVVLRRFRDLKRRQEQLNGPPPDLSNIDNLFEQQRRA
jgi:DNA-binding XRE family transcriptional regulator